MSNVRKHPASGGRPSSDDNSHVIDMEGIDRLWRAQMAATLLAALNNEAASAAGVSHDATAAVAEYIRDDMLQILNHSTEPDNPI